jgi:hypothetical protein
MEIKIYNVIHTGDLYRFYVSEQDDVLAVRCYPLMGTQFHEVNLDDLDHEIKDKLETKLTS